MGDDAVQLARGHYKVAALLGLHQGRDACRYDRHPQPGGVQMTAIYHPSALLRDVTKRPETFEDLKSIQARIRAVCTRTDI